MRYYMIAGEASGDLHGSNLMKGIFKCDPEAQIRFWGGDLMDAVSKEAQGDAPASSEPASAGMSEPSREGEPASSEPTGGCGLVRHYREGAVMGLTDVITKARTLLGNVSFCKTDIAAWRPDVVILIDYPGFNFKIAKFAHESGIKVFYYIAPKTWASRERRNAHLKEWVDSLFIIFPFEIPYFKSRGIPFTYCGNPLVDSVDSHEYRRPVEGRYIAVLPGSRKGEISRMMPVCMEVADLLGCQVVIAGAPARSPEDYTRYIGPRANVKLIFGRTYDILKYADAAVINSGTASLEAALIGTPQVVCWSSTAITVWAARHILKVGNHIHYISLGNLIVDKPVFRELIQEQFNTAAVFAELRRIMEDSSYRAKMQEGYAEIRSALAPPEGSGPVPSAGTGGLLDFGPDFDSGSGPVPSACADSSSPEGGVESAVESVSSSVESVSSAVESVSSSVESVSSSVEGGVASPGVAESIASAMISALTER